MTTDVARPQTHPVWVDEPHWRENWTLVDEVSRGGQGKVHRARRRYGVAKPQSPLEVVLKLMRGE